MDIATIKQRQQATWASGDFSAVDLRAGQQVLDVACGSGNAALAAAPSRLRGADPKMRCQRHPPGQSGTAIAARQA